MSDALYTDEGVFDPTNWYSRYIEDETLPIWYIANADGTMIENNGQYGTIQLTGLTYSEAERNLKLIEDAANSVATEEWENGLQTAVDVATTQFQRHNPLPDEPIDLNAAYDRYYGS